MCTLGVDQLGQRFVAMAQTQALLLNAEIAAVLSSMRQNAKWALIPKQYSVRTGPGLLPAVDACAFVSFFRVI